MATNNQRKFKQLPVPTRRHQWAFLFLCIAFRGNVNDTFFGFKNGIQCPAAKRRRDAAQGEICFNVYSYCTRMYCGG